MNEMQVIKTTYIEENVKNCDVVIVQDGGAIYGDIKNCKNVVIINSPIYGDLKKNENILYGNGGKNDYTG